MSVSLSCVFTTVSVSKFSGAFLTATSNNEGLRLFITFIASAWLLCCLEAPKKKAKKWKNYSPIWIDDTTSMLLKFWHWNIKKRENLIVFCKVKEYNLLGIFCLKMKHSPSVSSFILSPNMPFTSLPMLFIPNAPPVVPSPSLGVVEWLTLPLVWWTISHQEMDQALHFYDISKTISLKQ